MNIGEISKAIQEYEEAMACNCEHEEKSCSFKYLRIGDQYYKRDASCYDFDEYCGECGIANRQGNVHHGNCSIELCPACGGQFYLDSNHGDLEAEMLTELPYGAVLAAAKFDRRHMWMALREPTVVDTKSG